MWLRCCLIALCLVLAACGERSPALAPLPAQARVLVLGDSLVAGTGATPAQSWPTGLAQQTGWQVINAGIPGNTSADALARLPALLAEHRPDALIIAIGGNDFLRRFPPEETRRNITALMTQGKAATSHVALLAIPAPSVGAAVFGSLSDHPLYAELAGAQQVLLVPEVVAKTLSREEFRADRIHANAAGYARIADGVRQALAEGGWLRL